MSVIPVNLFQKAVNGGGAFAAVGPATGFPPPKSSIYFSAVNGGAGTGPILWLDSLLGLSGADQSAVTSWPDQSGNGYNANNTGAVVNPKLQVSTGVQTPNGKQTVRFFGQDTLNVCILGNASPNPWPAITNGYSFYFMFYGLTAVSSSGLQLLFDESGTSAYRFLPGDNLGSNYGYRDDAGAERLTTAPTFTLNAWHTARLINQVSGNNVNLTIDGTQATWAGVHTWTLTPGAKSGYTLGNLLSNEVTGFNGYLTEVIWYNVEHSQAQQVLLDNWMRFRFGLPLVTT